MSIANSSLGIVASLGEVLRTGASTEIERFSSSSRASTLP
jgi:hypothetical protein